MFDFFSNLRMKQGRPLYGFETNRSVPVELGLRRCRLRRRTASKRLDQIGVVEDGVHVDLPANSKGSALRLAEPLGEVCIAGRGCVSLGFLAGVAADVALVKLSRLGLSPRLSYQAAAGPLGPQSVLSAGASKPESASSGPSNNPK